MVRRERGRGRVDGHRDDVCDRLARSAPCWPAGRDEGEGRLTEVAGGGYTHQFPPPLVVKQPGRQVLQQATSGVGCCEDQC